MRDRRHTGDPAILLGEWSLHRRVLDRRLSRFGRMHGGLTVAAVDDGFSWVEQGRLTWAGQDLPVSRTLAICRIEGTWWMTFADGRPFHPWCPGQPVVHSCRADTYTGTLDIDPSRELLRILWDVTGPAKDQRIFSRCQRVPRRPPAGH